jgi:hypothetical protein
MKLTAIGGTDGASIVLFWPDNLPDDGDQRLNDDAVELVEQLQKEGKLIWFPCDGDGEYSLSVYVGSEIPAEVRAVCRAYETIPKLTPRGKGYFGGMEYVFKSDRSFLDKYPHMAEVVRIPEGTYEACVYTTEVPNETVDAWLEKRVGPRVKRLWKLHGIFAKLAATSVLAILIAAFVVDRTIWFWMGIITASFIAAAIGMTRTEWYRKINEARKQFEREFPSYVVELK